MLLDTGLYLTRNGTALTQTSAFLALNEAIVPELDALYWYMDGATSPFISLFYEDREDDIEPFVLSGEKELYRPGVLETFGDKIIANDWAEFVGYAAADDTEALKLADALASRAQILTMAEVALYNIDGMFWEFFTRHESFVEKVRQSPCFDSRPLTLPKSVSFGSAVNP